MNYKKINPLFFFIGVVLSILIGLFNSALLNVDFADSFWFFSLISICGCTLCFYRFNNGLIALFRGRFNMPKKSDLKYVDYSKCPIRNIQEFKDTIAYGDKCLIAYKLNSREVYQIIKQPDGLLVSRCYPEKNIAVETNYDNSIEKARNDTFIQYSKIKSVTYKISPNNYFLPIIQISVDKKCFSFIGYLEPFDRKDIDNFFSDITKVKGRNVKKSPDEQINEIEKITFRYNLFALLTCLVAPWNLVASLIGGTGVPRAVWSVYTIISVVLLVIYIYIGLSKSKKYKIDLINDRKNDGKKDISVGLVLLSVSMILSIVLYISIINWAWYLILCSIVFAVLIIKYFKSNSLPKGNSKENKTSRFCMIFSVVFVFVISSGALVSAVNYSVPLKSETRTYSVSEMYIEESDKSVDHYAKINIDGKKENVRITEETYNSHSSRIDVTKTVGILGIKYLVTEI
jgi:hypothetical protein